MKNNRITLSQFWFAMLLCCFSSLLFVDNKDSVWFAVLCASALLLDIVVIKLYKGTAGIVLKTVVGLYFILFSAASSLRFVEYLCDVLGYSPRWLIAFLLAGFAFICAVKGIEAMSRAGAVIGIFAVLCVLYILACAVGETRFVLNTEFDANLLPPLTLLFPSAAYVLLYDNISDNKIHVSFIYSAVILASVCFFSVISFGKNAEFPIHSVPADSSLGVFRGADFALLGLLSTASLYILSLGAVSLFRGIGGKYISNAVYTVVCLALVTVALYVETVGKFLLYQPVVLTLSSACVLMIILSSLYNRIKTQGGS